MNETERRPGRLHNQAPTGKLPLLGKVKVGEKIQVQKKNAAPGVMVEIPSTLDYFRATGKYADVFDKVLGKRPNKLGIMFISDDITQTCYERYECRDTSGALLGEGDGKHFKIWDANAKGMVDYVIHTEADRPKINAMGEWKQVLGIKFVIPAINTVMGIWAFETSGKASSIPNIRDTYDNVLQMAGTVINIPFDLTVEKVNSQKPGIKRTFPVVSLVPNLGKDRLEDIHSFLNAGNSVRDIRSLIEGNVPKQLEGKPVKEIAASAEETGAEEKPAKKAEAKVKAGDPDLRIKNIGSGTGGTQISLLNGEK